MKRETRSAPTTGGQYYNASVSSARPASDYTPRVVTGIPGVSMPLEASMIIWQLFKFQN